MRKKEEKKAKMYTNGANGFEKIREKISEGLEYVQSWVKTRQQ